MYTLYSFTWWMFSANGLDKTEYLSVFIPEEIIHCPVFFVSLVSQERQVSDSE